MLLSRKLKNQFMQKAETKNLHIRCNLKNITVNGENRGTSGFVVCEDNGCVVYINTESSVYQPLAGKSLYRYAENEKDFSSNGLVNGQNHFIENDFLVDTVLQFIIKDVGRRKG